MASPKSAKPPHLIKKRTSHSSSPKLSSMASPESAKKLFGPDPYPMINLLLHLHCDDDDLYQPAKTLFDYTKNHYPTALILKLFEMIQRNPLSTTGVRCYYLLQDLLPSLWVRLPSFTRKDLKIGLNHRLWLEKDIKTLKACVSCVASLAGLLFPKNEWDDLFYLMFQQLDSSCLYRKLGALLLWNDMIPICPEFFMPYIDFLIEGFKDHMPTVTEDHRCGVAAAKASVKLVLYLGNTANYSKFYDLMGYVMMTLFMALGEEGRVRSLLEDLIILAGAETEFFKVQIDVVIDSMVKIVGNLELEEETRQLGIEFVLTVAEDKENGCGMMQKINKDAVSKLLSQLIVMLADIQDDLYWRIASSDDENAGGMCSYAMESLDRLAIALGGNVILSSCPECLFNFLYDENWRIRHAAVTAIGLISKGCSKALLQEMGQLVETVVKLIHDTHPRVRWATIHAIGQLSKYLNPPFQEQYHQQILPALREVLDDFDNPRLQTRATSAILLFTRNCSSDVLKPYLYRIVSKLVVFLQRGMMMMKEAALETLASLAILSQEDSAYIYDSIMPYLKVFLVTATKDTSRMLLAKSLECITMMAMAVGNLAILDYVEKVTSELILLQETYMEVEDPMRSHLLQVWGRLCKCLGTDFLPYLSVAMPFVLKSAQLKNYLSVSSDSDTEDSDDESMIKVASGNKKIGIRSALLEEKALACHILSCFAAELKEGLHLWITEVVSALVPNLTFKFSEEVRIAAISAMPLLLHSAAFAVRKGLPVTGCGKPRVQKLSDTIIPPLFDALQKESKVQIQARLLDAFNEIIQIPGSNLSKHQAAKFIDCISEVLSTCSYRKTEREKRVRERNDSREQELLKEETEQHLTICRNIGICLGTMVKNLKASFLPLFDKFLPHVSLMWSNDRTAEARRVVVHLFRDVAEQCREDAFRYYENWIPLLLRVYDHNNPDVQQLVATAVGICAEFGGDILKPHTIVIFNHLKSVIEHPDAKRPDNIMAYEAAVSTCGKLSQFVWEGIYTYKLILLWLTHLPIRCNLEEAKISHELLCSMIETSEMKIVGPHGAYTTNIIAIFAEVLWAGNNLATEETIRRMINILKKFQREHQPSVMSNIYATLPLPHQSMLRTVLSTI